MYQGSRLEADEAPNAQPIARKQDIRFKVPSEESFITEIEIRI